MRKSVGFSKKVSWVLWIVLTLSFVGGCTSWRAAQLYQSGTVELDRGEYELAIADLERASELAPQASQVQNHLGLALAATGREDEAREALRRAVALDCTNDAAAHNLSLIEASIEEGGLGRADGAKNAAESGETREAGEGEREIVSLDGFEPSGRESTRDMMEPNP
jgi:tetratricopeptide (TPR) repeat protein